MTAKDEVRKFGIAYAYNQFLGMDVGKIVRLMERFDEKKVEKALEKRNNNGFNRKIPLNEELREWEKWELSRQFP